MSEDKSGNQRKKVLSQSIDEADRATTKVGRKVFTFKEQIEVGNKGEAWLKANYHMQPLQKLDYKSAIGDFMRPDGKIIEIKTDTYPLARTQNFFLEYYSNLQKKSIGGPWRTFEHGADIFLYLFSSDNVYFESTNVLSLVREADEIIKRKKLRQVYIHNQGYTTTGYKVERELLKDHFTEYKPEVKDVQPE
jgi:hypothetical protein